MLAELLYFSIYTLQQLGVVLCVGAQTMLLCTHLMALHRGEAESPLSAYARAARVMLGAGLALVIISGAAAVGVHYAAGELSILLAPVFLAKWALVAGLAAAFAAQRHSFSRSTVFYAAVGSNWYAVFLIHTLAPVASWTSLGFFYAAWIATFCVIWFGFAGLMRLLGPKKEHPEALPKVLGSPSPSAQPDHLPAPALAPPTPPLVPKPKSVIVVAPPSLPPPPKPEPVVVPPPPLPPKPEPPVVQGPIDAAVHTDLPVIAPEHPLAVFKKTEAPPKSPVPPPVVEKKPGLPLQQVQDKLHEIVDYLLIPALRTMPQRPEDIGTEKRGPVIK